MAEIIKIVKTAEQLLELIDYLKDKDCVAYDTETTGLDAESEIIGISVAAEPDLGWYVVLSYWDREKLVYLETKSVIHSLLKVLLQKDLVMHNSVFDCAMTRTNFGVDLMPKVAVDTMILAQLLDENRPCGLKELGTIIFGDKASEEQKVMKDSVLKNGGQLTRKNYEIYKAECDILAKYGAKDAILTIKLFYHLINDLGEQDLSSFFFKDESMPLLQGPTYDLNTSGLKVDSDKLQKLKQTLETECMEAKAFIIAETFADVKDKYPGDKKTNHFNIGSSKQLSWLLFFKLGNQFDKLTEGGRELCHSLGLKLPYSPGAKREFIAMVEKAKGEVYAHPVYNYKTKKMSRPKKVKDPWEYIACDKATLKTLETKYKWVKRLLEYAKNLKLLNTYVVGIQTRMKYSVIRPSFLQHGTTSGRYSSRNPNFQNLPKDDKRVKACIIARPGKAFVGADYSQLEPRIFASFSNDERLLKCFSGPDDFYSVIGAEVFGKTGLSMVKDDQNSFANKYPALRQISKVIALSATYGTTAPKMAPLINKSIEATQEIINDYFDKFPSVKEFMKAQHTLVKEEGRVHNLFGRVRRLPEAKKIYKHAEHSELKYDQRNLLNLSVNHAIQSTGASIMNRAAIKLHREMLEQDIEAKIVLQVHDSLVVECKDEDKHRVAALLKSSMETAVILPNVSLVADPKIGINLSEVS